MRTILILAAVVAAVSLTAARTASACGMPYNPEPVTEIQLAEAAELEKAEQPWAAIRIYERAMYDHRAETPIRVKAAFAAARLRAQTGDTDASNEAYAFAARLTAEAAYEMFSGTKEEPVELSQAIYFGD